MIVRELIAELQKLDPEMQVFTRNFSEFDLTPPTLEKQWVVVAGDTTILTHKDRPGAVQALTL